MLITRRAARLFFGTAGGLEETDRIEDDVHRQHDQGGWSQSNYQRSVEKEKDDHVAGVLDVLFTRFRRTPFDHLLIGAPRELVGEVEQRLHPYLRERLAGRVSVEIEHASAEDVRKAAAEAVRAARAPQRARGAGPADPGRRRRRARRRRACSRRSTRSTRAASRS